jgi:Carboxypeptidase regulatory-like domain
MPLVILAIALCTIAPASVFAQGTALPPPQNQDKQQTSVSQPGIVKGTITDVNDTPVPDASVALQGSDSSDLRLVTTDENGFFEIRDVQPGRPYQVNIRAEGFSEWDSPPVTLGSGQSEIVDAKLRIEEVKTAVTVTPESSDEIATKQVEAQERQRGFLIIPNFYAAYVPNPAPLNAKLKFRLALRVARDPFTFAGVGIVAGIGQATYYPDYPQGAIGYGERLGTSYANSFTDIMLDGAILPSLLHQDPRYFYKGTGTMKARAAHVVYSLIVARGDNGQLQPNYSQLGGDLISAAISNLYYPKPNRGVGLVFRGFATDTAIHLVIRMLDEFVFRPAKGSVAQDPH